MSKELDLFEKERTPKHGKKPNQKMKPYLVMQYLMKNSDEEHPISSTEIIDYLNELGIDAERRSIYRDVEDINKAYLIDKFEYTIEDAEEDIEQDEDSKLILYNNRKKGFYINQYAKGYNTQDIMLIEECIKSAKFITDKDANDLADIVKQNLSTAQSLSIHSKSFVVNRVKTKNKNVLTNIGFIRDAMSDWLDGEPHIPQKISFNYLTHEIGDLEKLAERRRKYVVSPYYLIINDGNYYLLAFDDSKQDMRTFRVDRIKRINFVDEMRDGQEAFMALDMTTYAQRVFSMFGGEERTITLRCINPLLDTMIDRFGTKDVLYLKADNSHFRVMTKVEVSDQFFSWVCGFGRKVIIETEQIAKEYKAYLDKISEMYK